MGISKKAGKRGVTTDAPGSHTAQSDPRRARINRADYKETLQKRHAGVTDLCLLSTITNEAINDNLQKRFENKEIYTYIGHVLISVNPFRDLGIYTSKILQSYQDKNRLEMPPHVYAIAESMVKNMIAYKENQCVIISGESGAGKTEAAKRIMQYIAEVERTDSYGSESTSSKGINQVKEMVLATNPLLESFGCAKTLRNDNSSRHGKYLEIFFDSSSQPIGASITNYLLEKGRVVGQIDEERNFHIFYQFTKAASAAHREEFGIQEPGQYLYLSKGRCLDVRGIDDVKDFAETLTSMRTIGLTEEEQNNIFRIIATVLWIGNIVFTPDEDGNATISDPAATEFVAYLMNVDQSTLTKALTIRIMETQKGLGRRGSVYEVPMNVTQATSSRDALAKALYNNLFEWIVDRINISMQSQQEASNIIGILDIYGFEIFKKNAFEQLCINYVNEKLQQIFIQLTLKAEQEEYDRERIKWTPIDYFNNKIVCDLIEEKRPPGIFAALNDACATAHADPTAADTSFVQRLGSVASNPHFESRGSLFLVKHYAGDVMYTVAGMTDKNKDTLSKDLLSLITSSSNPYMHLLFPNQVDLDSKKRPISASDRIKSSANALVEKLMRSQPSYIRTIKPNGNRSPSEYDTKAILHQVKYLGLQENVRVRRAGFAYRNTFEKMVERFYLLSKNTSYAGDYTWQGDVREACEIILKDVGISKTEWQMGVTKAFIKSPETLFALETMRDKYWHNMAARIQRCWRAYLRRKREAATTIQRWFRHRLKATDLIKFRDQGHSHLAGRKERRRASLTSARRFFGDYLLIGHTPGAELRRIAQIGSQERILFSSRGEVLTSKFGRSSTPSPRFLIMTSSYCYVLISQYTENGLETMVERKISLRSIQRVSLTNLQDDWLALQLNSPSEPDLFFNCLFKTEMITWLKNENRSLIIEPGPTLSYAKKPGKLVAVKAIRMDHPMKMDDKSMRLPTSGVYKSQTISVTSGMPSNSVSNRAVVAFKAVRSVGVRPSSRPSHTRATSRSDPRHQRSPHHSVSHASSRSAPALGTPPTQRQSPTPAVRSPPQASRAPPPPPPPAARATPQWRVKFSFVTEDSSQVSLLKGEIIKVLKDDGVDWWWVEKADKSQGWAPATYIEKEASPQLPPPPPSAPPRAVPHGGSSTSHRAPTAQQMSPDLNKRTVPRVPERPSQGAPAQVTRSPVQQTPQAPAASKSKPPAIPNKPKPMVPKKPQVLGKPATPMSEPSASAGTGFAGRPKVPKPPSSQPSAAGQPSKIKPVGSVAGQTSLSDLFAARSAQMKR